MGKIKKAESIFSLMVEDGVEARTDVTFNALINAYMRRGLFTQAREIIGLMRSKGINPTNYTYNTIITGYSRVGKIEEIKGIMKEMSELGLKFDQFTYNSLIYAYSKSGNYDKVWELINVENLPINQCTYNLIINSYVDNNLLDQAVDVIDVMSKRDLSPDRISYNTILNGFSKQCLSFSPLSSSFSLLLSFLPRSSD